MTRIPAFTLSLRLSPNCSSMRQARKLPADHPGAAPGLIRLAAVGRVERDLVDRGAAFCNRLRRLPADRVDLGVDADSRDVGDIGDPQPARVLAALHLGERARPRRRDRDRREPAQARPWHRASTLRPRRVRASGPCTWPGSQARAAG